MPLCQNNECTEEARYGLIKGKRLFCKKHKTPDMIDLKHKLCEYEECGTIPAFGIEGGKPTHCGRHRTDDMINVLQPTCRSEWCTYQVPPGTK